MNPYAVLAILLLLGGLQLIYGVIFFSRIRPRIRRYLSAHLGIPIRDGYSGAWTTEAGSAWRVGCLIGLLDLTLNIGAMLGPLACLLLALLWWIDAA